MIKIIAVGNLKEDYLKKAEAEYLKRLSKYVEVKIIEIKEEGLVEESKALKLEGEKISKCLSNKDYIFIMDINGTNLTSVDFADKINKTLITNSNLTFIIGGSYGIFEELKKQANFKLSFSKMTFPHQMFRIMLLEQIYRGYKINNNEKYHK